MDTDTQSVVVQELVYLALQLVRSILHWWVMLLLFRDFPKDIWQWCRNRRRTGGVGMRLGDFLDVPMHLHMLPCEIPHKVTSPP